MAFVPVVSNYCGHGGIAIHPNGTFFLAFQHIIPGSDGKARRNLEIYKFEPGKAKALFKQYQERIDFPGPLGHCDIALRATDGALIVALSAETSTNPDVDNVKGGYDILPGAAPKWSEGAVTSVTDETARRIAAEAAALAAEAVKKANLAVGVAGEAQTRVVKAEEKIASLATALDGLQRTVSSLPSDARVAEVAWIKAGDRIAFDQGIIEQMALGVLVEAIEYAKTATASQSRLRALIEDIVKSVA
jgi:hypothetical protein